jgi:tRNA modification GTPase
VRGVVRISGERARAIAEEVWAGDSGVELGGSRGVFRGRLFDGVGEQPLLLLWMPGPRSFTREDVAEFHLPGSAPLLKRALLRIVELGARVAEPGEFTRRAFESGRIDLSRAEGVLSVIEARSMAAHRSAVALLVGGLDERIGRLRNSLDDLRALCESSLDFDADDTIDVPTEEIRARLSELQLSLEEACGWEAARGLEAGVPRVVLVGAPNAGKSALFNALGSGEQVAIVSDHPGTTRDRLVRDWRPDAALVELADIAGIEEGRSAPDKAAQRVGGAARSSADHLLWVVDSRRRDELELEKERSGLPSGVTRTLVWSQSDHEDAQAAPMGSLGEESWVALSSLTGEGLEALGLAVAAALDGTSPSNSGRELSVRHTEALNKASEAIVDGVRAWEDGLPLDLLAAQLSEATSCIDQITGRTTPEDLLDRIFSRFCLGK